DEGGPLEWAEQVRVVRPDRAHQLIPHLAQGRDDAVVRPMVGNAAVRATEELPVLRRELRERVRGTAPGEAVQHDVQRVGGLRVTAQSGASEGAESRGAGAGDHLAVADAGAVRGGGVEELHRPGRELGDQTLVAA